MLRTLEMENGVTQRWKPDDEPFRLARDEADRELKHATFLSHGRQPEANISHARTVESPRFSN